MINNIKALNNNSVLEVNNLIEFSKSFVFKNKFVADNNETKLSLTKSSLYIKYCLNFDGLSEYNNIKTYVKNTYESILKNKTNNLINQEFIDLFVENKIIDNINSDDSLIELNLYYRKLFIKYYSNIINTYGDIEESYDNNIINLENSYPTEFNNLLLYIFNCRIYNHLDILYYNPIINNIKIDKFISDYHTNKTYFLKTIYTEGFEIQENYFNFCKFFIVFMTIQKYINDKTEIIFDIDLLDEYSIRNLLYSYGIYFLDDLPIYSQKRVIRNIQRLLNNKGNNQVIANILDIFELPDNTVFKYYMEKTYENNIVNDINFVGIPYNEYSYLNYIDSNKEKHTKPFDYFTKYDKSWYTTKSNILEPTNNIDFDYVETKYLSIESSFEIQTFAAECAFFFDTIYRSKEYPNNIFTQNKIKTNYSNLGFDIFDGVIALATLSMLINGAEEPIIFKSNYLNNIPDREGRYAFLNTINNVEGLTYYDDLESDTIYYDDLEDNLILVDDLLGGETSDINLSNSSISGGINLSKYFIINSEESLNDTLYKINNNVDFIEKYGNVTLTENNYTDYIELLKYYTIDNIKDEDIDNMLANVNENFKFKNDLESIIVNVSNYRDYINLTKDYNKLYRADTNRSYFSEHDDYLDYLKVNNIDLYNFIYPAYKTDLEEDLLIKFNILVQDLKDFLDNNSLIWDIPYRSTITKYLYYTIDYFKSYTVQLTDLKILFRFDNKLENRLFLLDKEGNDLNYEIRPKIADLVGGELFELQERPLSLHDNFYNNGLKYRNITTNIKSKDSLKTKLIDSFNITSV